MAKNSNIASVLAFEKKLVPSDGFMYGTVWDKRNEKEISLPLRLREKSVRGTISNRLKTTIKNDPVKLNTEVQKPNLQRIDSCALELDQDTLRLHFTLKVLSGVQKPSACNNKSFNDSFSTAAQAYMAKTGFVELARRYAANIANARFLWRNRIGARRIEVQVKALNHESQQWVFDAAQLSLREFNTNDDIDSLATAIAKVLSGKQEVLILEINAFALVGEAQEVYPSEELVLDKTNGKNKKSRILYHINDIAAIHSQKIGNALRTIDTWYPDYTTAGIGPIAVEPYGAVTNLGIAYRNPKNKADFYTLFDRFSTEKHLDSLNDEHYVMAVLVRGGVFGESGKE